MAEEIIAPAVPEEEKVEEILEEFEAPTRSLSGWQRAFTFGIGLILAGYALYGAVATIPTQIYRSAFVLFVFILTFLLYPGWKDAAKKWRTSIHWLDWILAALGVITIVYILINFEQVIYRAATATTTDIVLGVICIILVLEATRRTIGWHLAVLAVIFLLYAYAGNLLPYPFGHRGYEFDRLVGHMYLSMEGIFGIPIDVASSFVVLFTIYGAILDASGAGKFFVDFSFAALGRKPTGPGRTVTMASFLLGGPSGSGVATTVTLGTIAYPMLKKAGYSKEDAGGLLSAGGIGAVISPPVLGAASFLIAEFLKISYLQVITMSLVPTILYYFSIFLMVELDARRFGIKEVPIEAPPARELLLKYGYHLSSLFAIVVFMLLGFTAIYAVLWATIFAVLFATIRPESTITYRWMGIVLLASIIAGGIGLVILHWPEQWASLAGLAPLGLAVLIALIRRDSVGMKLPRALESGARQVLSVAATCATAGMIVGVFTLTGLGLKLSDIVVSLAGGNLFFTLVFAAIAVWLLGLALPITASYIVAVVMVGPALTKLGVPDFAAHMFVFYYAVLSEVSPPVGLSPFAASAITGGNPYKTMMMAWKYTLPAFIVPFMFTLTPEGVGLLAQGPWQQTLWVTFTALVGLAGLVMGVGGWVLRRANWLERALLILGGLALIYPSPQTDLPGLGLALAGALLHVLRIRQIRQPA